MKTAVQVILLVEDDPNDVLLLEKAFESVGIDVPIQVAANGEEAVAYLAGDGKYADRGRFPIPSLMLLDLKLPIRMGFEVLAWLMEQHAHPGLVAIVFSSSDDPRDIREAYRLGASSFLVKPVSTGERVELARAVKNYWFEQNYFAPVPDCECGGVLG